MKGIFFDSLLISIILITGARAENHSSIRYLITATNGLQFQKIQDHGQIHIIYDCSVGLSSEGVVNVFDKLHPEEMNSLTIQNCSTINLKYCMSNERRGSNVFHFISHKEVTVKDTKIVSLSIDPDCHYYHPFNHGYNFGFTNERYFSSSVTLNLQNVSIENLKTNAITPQIIELNLENVNIQTVEKYAIVMGKHFQKSILTITNSRIENIHADGIVFDGAQVTITNNSFIYLKDSAFNISAKESFLFSGNHVPKIGRSMNVSSPVVEIIGNTFVALDKNWLKQIIIDNQLKLGVLNITKNAMNIFSFDLLDLNTNNSPDVMHFSQNMFNCTCQFWNFKDKVSVNPLSYIFLNSNNKNVCQNLGNCSLSMVIKNMEDLCDDQFTCSESKTPTTKSYLEMILSALKNIASKLDVLISSRSYQNLTHTNDTQKSLKTVEFP